MPHAFGKRARTRDLFSRPFRKHGPPNLSRLQTIYKVNDFVDIVADGSEHRGMPHKFYHGKTGKIFNVTPHAVGVIVNKQVRNRIIPKRIHVRIQHVRKSQCHEAFKQRVRENDAKKIEAKKNGQKISTKRIPEQPRESRVAGGSVIFMNPLRHRDLF